MNKWSKVTTWCSRRWWSQIQKLLRFYFLLFRSHFIDFHAHGFRTSQLSTDISHKTGWIYQSLTEINNYVFLQILIFFIFVTFCVSKVHVFFFLPLFVITISEFHHYLLVQFKPSHKQFVSQSHQSHTSNWLIVCVNLRGWTVNWVSEEQFVMSTSKSDAGGRRPTSIQTHSKFSCSS